MTSKLLPLPKVRDLLNLYSINAKSRLSQNFILDKNVTDTIVAKAKIEPKKSLVVEVGPGPGLLSRSILDFGAENLVAIERDDRFMPLLNQLKEASGNRFIPLNDDILTIEHSTILKMVKDKEIESVHLIGNLPFNISTTLLLDWLKMMSKGEGLFSLPNLRMTLMFQFEVGQVNSRPERIAADAGNTYRGRLSVMAQSLCKTREIYLVNPASFVPQPKVKAVVVNFERMEPPLLQSSFESLENLTRILFQKRRKTVSKIMKMWNPAYIKYFEKAQVPLFLRPQEITTQQMCALAKLFEDDNIQLENLKGSASLLVKTNNSDMIDRNNHGSSNKE